MLPDTARDVNNFDAALHEMDRVRSTHACAHAGAHAALHAWHCPFLHARMHTCGSSRALAPAPRAAAQVKDSATREALMTASARAQMEQNLEDAEAEHACPLCCRAFDTEALFLAFLQELRGQLVADNAEATQA